MLALVWNMPIKSYAHIVLQMSLTYWVKFKPKYIHHRCIVSSLVEEPLNKSMGHENLFFFIKQYFTWVEEVLFIFSKGNPPTLGIWYNLILRYSGSFFEYCRRLIFFCCNLIPKGKEQKKNFEGANSVLLKRRWRIWIPMAWLKTLFLYCSMTYLCFLDFNVMYEKASLLPRFRIL
jgi:hypothetical protein